MAEITGLRFTVELEIINGHPEEVSRLFVQFLESRSQDFTPEGAIVNVRRCEQGTYNPKAIDTEIV